MNVVTKVEVLDIAESGGEECLGASSVPFSEMSKWATESKDDSLGMAVIWMKATVRETASQMSASRSCGAVKKIQEAVMHRQGQPSRSSAEFV